MAMMKKVGGKVSSITIVSDRELEEKTNKLIASKRNLLESLKDDTNADVQNSEGSAS